MNGFDFFSVEDAPDIQARVVFTTPSSRVFREDRDIVPLSVGDDVEIMPWGYDNLMPFRLMDLIDSDEVTATCMSFTQETTYGNGLSYQLKEHRIEPPEFKEFRRRNKLNSLWMGQAADMKMFDFCVSVVFLSEDCRRIERVVRKHAAYCRFGVADECGNFPFIAYYNWRLPIDPERIEFIPVLDVDDPLGDLRDRIRKNPHIRKYAVVSMVPKASSTYYPIPSWGSLFKGSWFDIKRLIGEAKKAKLSNAAPIKYHIEVESGYWERAIRAAGITDPEKQREEIKRLKKQMIDFLSGAQNSGKVLFSSLLKSPDGKEIPEVRVNKISSDEKEGGDYATDIQEAVNMICFAMRVHSNLVGSVPGKSQSNNSGSDKRELYTIAQVLQHPYHDIMLEVHRLICDFNNWDALEPSCSVIQLTTLDEHKDMEQKSVK